MSKLLALCGKICSGKTHYARQLLASGGGILLSCDELTKALFDNDLGAEHDAMAVRIRAYLRERGADAVAAGCDVILDWGFWSRADRAELSAFCRIRGIVCEWHYVQVDDTAWQQNITERNARILQGLGGSDYYLDAGLLAKLLTRWEEPTPEEIDVLHRVVR